MGGSTKKRGGLEDIAKGGNNYSLTKIGDEPTLLNQSLLQMFYVVSKLVKDNMCYEINKMVNFWNNLQNVYSPVPVQSSNYYKPYKR